MLYFSVVPESYLAEMQKIESRSNPHSLTEKSLATSFKSFDNLGCFIDSQLVAFVLYRVVLDEAEIIHIVSDANKQRNGYARELLKQLFYSVKNTQGVNSWHLEVRESNKAAQRLYKCLGFKKVGQRMSYYKDYEAAILMKLTKL